MANEPRGRMESDAADAHHMSKQVRDGADDHPRGGPDTQDDDTDLRALYLVA